MFKTAGLVVFIIFLIYMRLDIRATDIREAISKLVIAEKDGTAFPLLSQILPEVTHVDAYKIQVGFVAGRMQTGKIYGYKAGLTSKAGQAKFKVYRPLLGVLFESGNITPGSRIKLSGYYRLMIETEIGYVLQQDIHDPVETIAELKQYVSHLVAVIELPDVRYKDLSAVTANDLIATNVAAKAFIVSELTFPVSSIDSNQIRVNLSRDAQEVNAGKGSDASGDQWQALMWLVNSLLKKDYQLEAGHLLITGALGNMIEAEPGHYVAHYTDLGSIEFTIE